MKQGFFKILSNEGIADRTFGMRLEGDTSALSRSGQFVQVCLPGFFLRRPISVCTFDDKSLTLIYRVVGEGTEAMSKMKAGDEVELISGLGNGFDASKCAGKALLIGGGAGTAPLLQLAVELVRGGKEVTAVLGFNKASEIILQKEFEEAGADVVITTADGSAGIRGFVTDALKGSLLSYDIFYTCGPRVMMKAVCGALPFGGEVSLEERMGCGFGICYGCTCQTTLGPKRVCKEGPVFNKEEVIW